MMYPYVSVNAENHVRQWFVQPVAETAPGYSVVPLAQPQEIIPLTYDMTNPAIPVATTRWVLADGIVLVEDIP